jgi:hypothetical protein
MAISILIRSGGLAATTGGALYVSAKLLDLPDPLGPIYYCGLVPCRGRFYVSVLLGAMAATLAIAPLYATRWDHGGGTAGMLTAVAAFVGLALMFWGVQGHLVAGILGALLDSVGVLALGLVTIGPGERVLPWWGGMALIVWAPAYVFWLVVPGVGVSPSPFPASWGELLAGITWLVVGLAVFQAPGRRTERPSRVR